MPYAPDSYPRQIPQFKVHGRGEVTVSAKGIITGDSNIPNDGADFGPDTMLEATETGQDGPPYTQTCGIQEAYQYAITTGKSLNIDSGIFPLNQRLFFNTGNIHIHGQGFSTVLQATSTITYPQNGNWTIECSGNFNNLEISDLTIDNSIAPNILVNLGGNGAYTNSLFHDLQIIAPSTNSGNGGISFNNISQYGPSYNFDIYNIYSPNGCGVSTYSYPNFDGPSFWNMSIHDIFINVTDVSLGDDRISVNLNNNQVTTGTYMEAFNFFIYNIYIYVHASTTSSSSINGMSLDTVTSVTGGIYTWMHDFEIRDFYLIVDSTLSLTGGVGIHFDGSSNFYDYTIDNFNVVNFPSAGYIRFNNGFNGVPKIKLNNIKLYNVSNGLQIGVGSSPFTTPTYYSVLIDDYYANGTGASSSIGLALEGGSSSQGWNGVLMKNIFINGYTTPVTNANSAWSGIVIDGIYAPLPLGLSSGTYTIKNSSNALTPSISTNPPVSGTVYQNTNPFDIEIDLPVYATTSGTAGYVTIAKGATSTPTTIGNQYVNGATSSTSADIIRLKVPAGWYYSFTASGVTFETASVFAD